MSDLYSLLRKRPLLSLILLILILVQGACRPAPTNDNANSEAKNGQSAIATTIAEISPFTPEEDPVQDKIGESRDNPHPPGTVIEEGQWTIEVLETERGEDAWQTLHLSHSHNQLPPEGWEYLNVNMRLKNSELSTEDSYLPLGLTGDARIKYLSFNNDAISPEPRLDTSIPGRGESEGWETFLIHENEKNLMFVFTTGEYGDPRQYLAIEEGAAVNFDQELIRNITRTDLGVTQDQPVPFGQTATGEDWQLIVLDVATGEDAWTRVLEENQFNDPPEEGMEYVLIKLRARYIGLNEEGEDISDYEFSIRTNSGNEFDTPSVVDPEPDLDHYLYPGGEAEGWIVLTVPEKTKNLTMFFSPDSSGANDRYLSLGQGR